MVIESSVGVWNVESMVADVQPIVQKAIDVHGPMHEVIPRVDPADGENEL